MDDLHDQLDQLRQRLRDGQDRAEAEKAAAEAKVTQLEESHQDELVALRSEVRATQAELEARRAAERRAKLELRARRETATRARAEADGAKSELAELAAERAARAKEFQAQVGLTPRGTQNAAEALPQNAAACGAVAACEVSDPPVPPAPPAPLAPPRPSADALQLQLPGAPAEAAGPAAALTARGLNQAGAAAAKDRYDQLTPRTGAKAAQIASISALMSAADADDDGLTPRPSPRLEKAAPNLQLPVAAPPKKPLTPGTETELRAAFRAARSGEGAAADGDAAAGEGGGNKAQDGGVDRHSTRKEVRALQSAANEAARQSVSAGADARRALQQGDLAEASRLAAVAETHAAEARTKRRLAEELHAKVAPSDGAAGILDTPREGAAGFAGPDKPTTARRASKPPSPPVHSQRAAASDAALLSDTHPDAALVGSSSMQRDTPSAPTPTVPALHLNGHGLSAATPSQESARQSARDSARSETKGIRNLFRRRGSSASPRDASPRRVSSDDEAAQDPTAGDEATTFTI